MTKLDSLSHTVGGQFEEDGLFSSLAEELLF